MGVKIDIMKNKNTTLIRLILIVVPLVILDQGSKLYFKQFMGKEYELIEGVLSIKPVLHTNLYYASLLNMNLSRTTILIIGIAAMYFTIAVYRYLRNSINDSKLLIFSFGFGFAGVISSFFDTLIRGGALDFINLENFFIFDVKDIYLKLYVIILISFCLINWKALNNTNKTDFIQYLRPFNKRSSDMDR